MDYIVRTLIPLKQGQKLIVPFDNDSSIDEFSIHPTNRKNPDSIKTRIETADNLLYYPLDQRVRTLIPLKQGQKLCLIDVDSLL